MKENSSFFKIKLIYCTCFLLLFFSGNLLSTTLDDDFVLMSDNSYYTILFMPFDVGGYSDWWEWGYSDLHPYNSHEMLSGEYGAAIYYTNISTEPNAMWLTDSFSYPVWPTNSTFSKKGDAETTYSVFNDPNNPCTGDDTAYSIIKNPDLTVRIDYEIVSLGTTGFGAINCLNDEGTKSAFIKSEKFLLLQTYTFINDANESGNTLENFEFYQFIHGHPGNQYSDCVSIYDKNYYPDNLENYLPYNPIHEVGDFKYQITQWNETTGHKDWLCFASNQAPVLVENGVYEGCHNCYVKPARPGSHWNVEERNFNGKFLSEGQVAGALGWSLGDIPVGESESITLAIMFGHGEPVVCSLDVDVENITDPNSLVDYCGIDPLNSDPNYYTVEYSIDYGNPVTDSGAVDYLGTLTDVVLTAELPDHIWPMPGDVVVYNGGSYNLIGRSITWDIGTLAPGASGTVYFTIKIMDTAEPGGEIITSAKLSSEKGWVRDSEYSAVCCYCERVYVDASAYGGYSANGISWSHAYPSLEDALARIEANDCGNEIWLAKGTYSPAAAEPFQIVDDVPMYGGFRGEPNETTLNDRNILSNKTTLSAGGADYVIYESGYDNIVLDGLTITGGSSAGLKFSSSDIAINNCIIAGNGAKGIEISSSDLTLTKSLVSDNGGDGVYSSSSKLTINQSMLRSNTESGVQMSSPGSGSIISNSIITDNGDIGINNTSGSNTVTVTNCSIIANGSHGASGDEDVDIINSIVWNNGPIEDPNAIYTYQDKVQAVECNVSYSCVQDPNDIEGLESGADTPDIDGNISAVPQFYFEPSSFVYYLRSTSPCRDIGNNNSASGTGDYYGQTRIVNTTVDMGAVEYDGPQICEDCNFDDSAAVDFKDYLYFADSWLAEDTDQNYDIACDLYPDDVIDDGDLMEFAECWLWEPDFIDTDDIMRVAHRSTGLEAIEPIEMMGMMSLPTIFVEGRDGIFYEVPAPEPQIETAVVSPLSSKSKPLSVEAAEMATTVYLLDEIYENSPPLSEEEYQQYLQFRESLITGYYQLITPQ